MSRVPPEVYEAVMVSRDRQQCQRCGGRATDFHHRQRRRDGGHVPSNGVALCRTCHGWAHRNPIAARHAGFIVSFAADPLTVPMVTFRGALLLDDEGRFEYVT